MSQRNFTSCKEVSFSSLFLFPSTVCISWLSPYFHPVEIWAHLLDGSQENILSSFRLDLSVLGREAVTVIFFLISIVLLWSFLHCSFSYVRRRCGRDMAFQVSFDLSPSSLTRGKIRNSEGQIFRNFSYLLQ